MERRYLMTREIEFIRYIEQHMDNSFYDRVDKTPDDFAESMHILLTSQNARMVGAFARINLKNMIEIIETSTTKQLRAIQNRVYGFERGED